MCFRQHNQRQRRRRKKPQKNLQKQIQELQVLLKKQTQKAEKYNKQVQRMKKNNASPRTKVKRQMRQLPRAAIQKTLLFHESTLQDIRNRYKAAQWERERQIFLKTNNRKSSEKVQAAALKIH